VSGRRRRPARAAAPLHAPRGACRRRPVRSTRAECRLGRAGDCVGRRAPRAPTVLSAARAAVRFKVDAKLPQGPSPTWSAPPQRAAARVRRVAHGTAPASRRARRSGPAALLGDSAAEVRPAPSQGGACARRNARAGTVPHTLARRDLGAPLLEDCARRACGRVHRAAPFTSPHLAGGAARGGGRRSAWASGPTRRWRAPLQSLHVARTRTRPPVLPCSAAAGECAVEEPKYGSALGHACAGAPPARRRINRANDGQAT
jgi:hypothetical protein